MKNSNYWCKVRWNPVTRVQKIPTWLFWFPSIIIIFLTNKFWNKKEDMIVASWSATCLAGGGLRVGVTDNATGGYCDAPDSRQLSLHSSSTLVKQSKVCFVGLWSDITPLQGSISIATCHSLAYFSSILAECSQYWVLQSVSAGASAQSRERDSHSEGEDTELLTGGGAGGAGLYYLCSVFPVFLPE